jgi:hypothetical protein
VFQIKCSRSVSDFREDEKCLTIREGHNKAGRFLEVAIEIEGGRIGSIWLPEGKKGWGWHRFVGEMRRMLELQRGKIGPTNDDFPSLPGKQVKVNATATYGFHSRQSFANLLRPTVGGVKRLSSCLLDLFTVSKRYEAELGRVRLRSTMYCYTMEAEQVLSKEFLVAPSLATLVMAYIFSLICSL